MKSVVSLCLALVGLNAFAVSPQVKITSFVYTANGSNVAELCGLVSEATNSPAFVKIIVDVNSKHPATYNTLAGADGKFCLLVNTYTGVAEANIF